LRPKQSTCVAVSMAQREIKIPMPCLRHCQKYPSSSHHPCLEGIHPKAPFHRGMLRGSSSLWFGRKYHRLNQTTGLPQHMAQDYPVKRCIHWDERVRVRRFEKVSPDLAQHCYYTAEELYSFHRECMLEEETDTSESSVDNEVDGD
jgi:hypothetical protein